MKVLGHRIKNYYTAIHTPLYSEEKNDGAYIFHMDVCRPEYQHSNMYLRFADKLNAKVSNDAETRFEIGFSLQDALVDVKMILSIFVFNLR